LALSKAEGLQKGEVAPTAADRRSEG
jgi:hypothetical protein